MLILWNLLSLQKKMLVMLIKNRIEFIDIAKGFTILIIVLTHTYGDSGGSVLEVLSIFKVPTFFALSGLFFKTYDSLSTFFRKKCNQLIIPLIFTVFFLSLPWNILLELHAGNSLIINNLVFMPGTNRFNFGMAPGAWFVLCLLFIESFFYLLSVFFRGNIYVLSFVSLFAGITGYMLNVVGISLPIWIDTALTSLPFFNFGVLLGLYSDVVKSDMSSKQWGVLFISFLFFLFSICLLGEGEIFYAGNRYSVNLICLYGGGGAGILIVILVSKIIKSFPLISYVGRFSLIVLLTHQLYLFVLRNIIYQLHLPQDNYLISLVLFIIVVLLSYPTIFLCKKYLPWAFGLKDVIK